MRWKRVEKCIENALQRISTRWQRFPTRCYHFWMRWQRFLMRWQRSTTRWNWLNNALQIFITYVLCVNRSFWLSRNKNKSKTIQWKTWLWYYGRWKIKKIRLFSKFWACVFPQTSDMRQNVSQKFTEASIKTHVVYLRVTSIRRPENIVDIYTCNLLSRQLIISTEQPIIYISTFPCTLSLTSNHAVSIYISTNSIVASYHVPP